MCTRFRSSRASNASGFRGGCGEHLFLLVIEVADLPRKIHETNWREYMSLDGVVPLVRMLLSGRPVIIVTGHLGNFELGGFNLGILGFPSYSVARPLDNPLSERFRPVFAC